MTDRNAAMIRNAILSGTAIKIFFAALDPDDAEAQARTAYTGHLDLAEWKPGTERPVMVGSERQVVRNWSDAHMRARSVSVTHGYAHAHSRGESHTTSTGTSSGSSAGAGESRGEVLPPQWHLFGPNSPNAVLLPLPTSQSRGTSTSHGTSEQSSSSTSDAVTESDTETYSESYSEGTTTATTRSEGGSEAFTPVLEWLPSSLYTLHEQMHRAVGELMNLPAREVVVKLRGEPAFRARTPDVPKAFQSAAFKKLMLPRYLTSRAAQSRYLRPAAEVDAELAARRVCNDDTHDSTEVDFSAPEAVPLVQGLRRAQKKFEPRKRAAVQRLRILDGGTDEDIHT